MGLIISPAKLAGIRKARVRAMGVPGQSDYSDLHRIQDELMYAQRLYRELGCEVLDVTDRAVEETAAMVMELVGNPGYRGLTARANPEQSTKGRAWRPRLPGTDFFEPTHGFPR